jgi:glucuronate isomerase
MSKSSKTFLGDDFLLDDEVSVHLYEKFAAVMPIADFHNHLSPKDIAENRKFNNLTEAWLEGDHYKWRAMRINGVSEDFITGEASPWKTFEAWSGTVPFTMRNPLYHWTHLELKNYFGIRKLLDESTAKEIYDECSLLLQQEDFRVCGLMAKMNVKVVCTTDDPADSLEYHLQFAKTSAGLKMYPTFRPDNVYATDEPSAYNKYIDRLSEVSKAEIKTFDDLMNALSARLKVFNDLGCRASDHGLEFLYFDAEASGKAPRIFEKIRGGKSLSGEECLQFRCAVMLEICKQYHAMGWVQQFHLGALRNNNARMMQKIGRDTGFDSIGDFQQAQSMSWFLNRLDTSNQLAKTVIYNLDPSQNEVFATMAGSFSDGSTPGKIQWGSAWWFLDQKDGMTKQINALSNMSLLSRFIGMVTDSRSILSFPRHEYFRRVLCNIIGADVKLGELPENLPVLGKMIQDVCYVNARNYFNF